MGHAFYLQIPGLIVATFAPGPGSLINSLVPVVLISAAAPAFNGTGVFSGVLRALLALALFFGALLLLSLPVMIALIAIALKLPGYLAG